MNSTARKAVISFAATLTSGAMMVAMTSETQARGGFGFRGGRVGFGGCEAWASPGAGLPVQDWPAEAGAGAAVAGAEADGDGLEGAGAGDDQAGDTGQVLPPLG